MERCDIHRSTSATALKEARPRFAQDGLTAECSADPECLASWRTSWNVGLAILPSLTDEYLTAGTGGGGAGWPTMTQFVRHAEKSIAEHFVSTDRCLSSMNNTRQFYDLNAEGSFLMGGIDGALREFQAHLINFRLENELKNLTSSLTRLYTRESGTSVAQPGAFVVQIAHALDLLREVPGAWAAWRREGTDKSVLMLVNAFADAWNDRQRGGEFACGAFYFGRIYDLLRDFVSTAGELRQPTNFFGTYVKAPAKVECERGKNCVVALAVTKPARALKVLGLPSGLKFNGRKKRIEGRVRRRGESRIDLAITVNGQELRAIIPVVVS
jgi:hypothetical protein